jgi:hypothetical protein
VGRSWCGDIGIFLLDAADRIRTQYQFIDG